jgi:CRP-like cAMP-binding protein
MKATGSFLTNTLHQHVSCDNCALQSCFILSKCPKSASGFSAVKQTLVFKSGSRLQGLNDGLYVLSSGKIKIFKSDTHDHEIILSFIKPGELFNVYNNENDYAIEFKALTDSVICFVDTNSLKQLAGEDAMFSMSLFKYQNEQIRRSYDKYFKTVRMHVPAKVADALLTMHETYGLDEEGNIDVKLSRLEIAALAATTKEQVSKALSELKSGGVIKTRGKKISIQNFDKLLSSAKF